MVLGYVCPECGFQRECDIADSGQRICPDCSTDVTGVTGRTRGPYAPPEADPMAQEGDINWHVKYGYGNRDTTIVSAFDYIDAIEKAIKKMPHKTPTNVKPNRREYRR